MKKETGVDPFEKVTPEDTNVTPVTLLGSVREVEFLESNWWRRFNKTVQSIT